MTVRTKQIQSESVIYNFSSILCIKNIVFKVLQDSVCKECQSGVIIKRYGSCHGSLFGERDQSTCSQDGSAKHSEKVSFSVSNSCWEMTGRDTYGRRELVLLFFLYNSAVLKKKVQTVQTGGSATTPTSPPQSWSVEFSDQTCSLTVLLLKNSNSAHLLRLPGHESRLCGRSRKFKLY